MLHHYYVFHKTGSIKVGRYSVLDSEGHHTDKLYLSKKKDGTFNVWNTSSYTFRTFKKCECDANNKNKIPVLNVFGNLSKVKQIFGGECFDAVPNVINSGGLDVSRQDVLFNIDIGQIKKI